MKGLTADAMVASIREAIVRVTESSLVGLYLFGSLATGDFDDGSDIDVITVLSKCPDDRLVAQLRRMHAGLADTNPEWRDRIEVIYVSARGMSNCRSQTATIAVISPGEPFHVVEAGQDWILNWYPAREDAVRLAGPPVDSVIPPIPKAEYLEQVRRSLQGFTHRIDDDASSGSQAYAILTMCRGLYALRFGERLSKAQAASWAQDEFPHWADLIRQALVWRRRQWEPTTRDGAATVSQTRRFVADMASLAHGPSGA